jgi:hypothetical protein
MKCGVIETSIGKVWLDEEGIIREKVHAGSVIDLDVAKEEIAAYAVLCKNEARPILVDIRNVKSITGEARSHLAGEESAKVTRAVALLIGSPLSRIIGNFFLGLNKTSFPSKLFTSVEEALTWLRGFLE